MHLAVGTQFSVDKHCDQLITLISVVICELNQLQLIRATAAETGKRTSAQVCHWSRLKRNAKDNDRNARDTTTLSAAGGMLF